MGTIWVYDPKTDRVVVKGTEGTRVLPPGAIVKKYEHVARCLPSRAEMDAQGRVVKGIPGHRGKYDRLGRAIVTSRQNVEDIKAAHADRIKLNWDTE